MKYVIVTQLKNQENRVYDWLKYHTKEGFDSFVLFDDFSEDNTITEIIRFQDDYKNIYISLNKTDGIGSSHTIENCSNSKHYELDMQLHERILRSVNSGLEIVKSINKDAICVVIDVDEFLLTDEDKKVTEVIDSIYKESDKNVYQICVFNFDIQDDYTLEKGFLIKNKFKRWSYEGMENNSHYRYRHKGMVIAGQLPSIRFIHYLRGPDIVPSTDIHNVDFRNYSRLRMIHFRKPNQNTDIQFVEDPILEKKLKNNLN